eukprot:1062901-Alexandrium_andersonii.AAC.1
MLPTEGAPFNSRVSVQVQDAAVGALRSGRIHTQTVPGAMKTPAKPANARGGEAGSRKELS